MFSKNQIFNNNISIYPSDLNKDIDNIILSKLKKTYEGYCKDNCFVLNNIFTRHNYHKVYSILITSNLLNLNQANIAY